MLLELHVQFTYKLMWYLHSILSSIKIFLVFKDDYMSWQIALLTLMRRKTNISIFEMEAFEPLMLCITLVIFGLSLFNLLMIISYINHKSLISQQMTDILQRDSLVFIIAENGFLFLLNFMSFSVNNEKFKVVVFGIFAVNEWCFKISLAFAINLFFIMSVMK